jgi:hypothetical protein
MPAKRRNGWSFADDPQRAGLAEPTDSPIWHAAIAMADKIRVAGDEIERAPPAPRDRRRRRMPALNGTPCMAANDMPETRLPFLKLSQCKILDTWYATGLLGTGSNDILVEDVFVEEMHSFRFQDKGLAKRAGPLYASPLLSVAKASAPALGIARR